MAGAILHKCKGKKFGRFLVLENADSVNTKVLCLCECKTKKRVTLANLKSGRAKSCGCFRREVNSKKGEKNNAYLHGQTNTPEHRRWSSMVGRCTVPSSGSYKLYGGRGIKVCARWTGDNGFLNFLEDMGPRPKGAQIERINNDEDYSPENCRWATRSEQARNRRSNRLLTLDGKTQCLTAWAEEYGISTMDLYNRLRQKWDLKKALTEPVKRKRKRII